MKNIFLSWFLTVVIVAIAGCATSPSVITRENNRQVAKKLLADAVERGQFELALDIYRQLPNGKNEPGVAFNGAIAMHHQGEYIEAEQLFQWLIANYPGSPKGVFGLALSRYLRGEPKMALDILTSHLDVVSMHPSTINLVALCFDMLGKYSEAQKLYSEIVVMYPAQREAAWLNSGYSYFVNGDIDKAKHQLSRYSPHEDSSLGRLSIENLMLFNRRE